MGQKSNTHIYNNGMTDHTERTDLNIFPQTGSGIHNRRGMNVIQG
jgi:hypothetical protein